MNIVDYIRILSECENGYADFEHFLKQNVGNTEDPRLILWQVLASSKSKYTDSLEERKSAYTATFGKKSYNASKMSKLLQQLCQQLNNFILLNEVKTTGHGKLLREAIYRRNNLDKKLEKVKEEILEFSHKVGEAEGHYLRWMLYKEEGKLAEAKQELWSFFTINRLTGIIEELTTCKGSDDEIPEKTKQELSLLYEMLPKKKSPLIQLQLLAVEYFMEPSKERYEAFKFGYWEKADLLNSEKRDLLLSVLNALAVFRNADEKMREDYALLYKFGIKRNLLVKNGQLESLIFNNILFVAEASGDYELIEFMLETQIQLVSDKKEQRRSKLLATAYTLFGKKDYQAALEILTVLENDKFIAYIFVLRKYLLSFKCSYEQSLNGKIDVLHFLDKTEQSFKKDLDYYLKQKYISETTMQMYLNFFNLLCKIANRTSTKKEMEKVLDSFDSAIVELKWLKEKIAAILIWEYIDEFKEAYDSTWHKYDALTRIKKKEGGFKKMISRYASKDFIHEKLKKSCLNFFNLLVRICDERNPRNAKRHLAQKMESYAGLIVEAKWVEEKINALKP